VWYTEEISKVTRNGLRYGTVEDWCDVLEKRFCDSSGKALAALEQSRYTTKEVREGRSPIAYVSNIILHGRSSGIAPIEHTQMLLAYDHVDGILRRDLRRPDPTTKMEEFISRTHCPQATPNV
jgi:hypothetical protein